MHIMLYLQNMFSAALNHIKIVQFYLSIAKEYLFGNYLV